MIGMRPTIRGEGDELMNGACAQRELLTSSQPASALRVYVGPTALQEKQQLQKE